MFQLSVAKKNNSRLFQTFFRWGEMCVERGREGGMKRENEKFHVNINKIRIFLFVKIAIIVTFGEDNQIIQGFVVWS